jgi:hypothetical protein
MKTSARTDPTRMKLMDIRIGAKLSGAFLLIVGMILGSGSLQIWNFSNIKTSSHEYAAMSADADAINDMAIAFQGVQIDVADSIIEADPGLLESKAAEFAATLDTVTEKLTGRDNITDHEEEDKAAALIIQNYHDYLGTVSDEIIPSVARIAGMRAATMSEQRGLILAMDAIRGSDAALDRYKTAILDNLAVLEKANRMNRPRP